MIADSETADMSLSWSRAFRREAERNGTDLHKEHDFCRSSEAAKIIDSHSKAKKGQYWSCQVTCVPEERPKGQRREAKPEQINVLVLLKSKH